MCEVLRGSDFGALVLPYPFPEPLLTPKDPVLHEKAMKKQLITRKEEQEEAGEAEEQGEEDAER